MYIYSKLVIFKTFSLGELRRLISISEMFIHEIAFINCNSLKIRRGPKLEGCAFVNFGNSSGTEEEPSQKREKNGGKKEK